MDTFLDFLLNNKSWIFSGAGVLIIAIVLSILKSGIKFIYENKNKNIIIEGENLKTKIVIKASSDIRATIHGVLSDTDSKGNEKQNGDTQPGT